MSGVNKVIFHPRCETGLYSCIKADTARVATHLPDIGSETLIFGHDGTLNKTGFSDSALFRSANACGSIPLFLNGSKEASFVAIVHSGRLTAIVRASDHKGARGFNFVPSWELDLRTNETIADAALRHDVEGLVDLIRMIEVYPGVQVATPSVDMMAAIALCDPSRLNGLSSQQAWSELSTTQREAVNRWLSTTK